MKTPAQVMDENIRNKVFTLIVQLNGENTVSVNGENTVSINGENTVSINGENTVSINGKNTVSTLLIKLLCSCHLHFNGAFWSNILHFKRC